MQPSTGRRSLPYAVLIALILVLLGPAGPSPAAGTGSADRHCVTRLETAETGCFDTFSAAVRVATGGLVELAPGARPDVAGRSFQRQVAAAGALMTESLTAQGVQGGLAAVWLSVEYSEPNYAGSSWITTAGSGCDGSPDYDHVTASLAGSGWDNQVSSFAGMGECQVEHWTGYSFSGHVNYGSHDAVFPWQVDDQTSSLRFY